MLQIQPLEKSSPKLPEVLLSPLSLSACGVWRVWIMLLVSIMYSKFSFIAGSEADVNAAVEAAAKAQKEWKEQHVRWVDTILLVIFGLATTQA